MSETFQFNHKFTFVWHTTWMNPCPRCQSLNGRVFTDQDLFQHTLWDPIYGDLWDLDNDFPLIHPNCKCVLEVQYTSSIDDLLFPTETDTFTRGGEPYTATRSTVTGQFAKADPLKEFGIMSSNIKEMKAELDDFDRDLQRAQGRIESTRAQLITYMLLLNRLGLPPEIDRAINLLIRFRMTAELASRAAYLLMAASGPWGWAMAAATTGVAVIGGVSIVADLSGQ